MLLLLGRLFWLLLLLSRLSPLGFLVGLLFGFCLFGSLRVLLCGKSLVILALLFTPLVRCLVVDAAQVGDLIDEHVHQLLIVNVIGVVSDLGLRAENDVMGFLWVCRKHAPVDIGSVLYIWTVSLFSG